MFVCLFDPPKRHTASASLGKTEIKLFFKKKIIEKNSICSIAENEDILRKVVITNQKDIASLSFLTWPVPGQGLGQKVFSSSLGDPGSQLEHLHRLKY